VKTQPQIAAYGTPGTANTWNYLYGVETEPGQPVRNGVDYILSHFAGLGTNAYGVALSQAALTSQINLFRPVGIRWAWDSGGGHILAVKGVDVNVVYLMDPWNGDTEISTYAWVVRSDSDGHTWTDSLTIATSGLATVNTPTSSPISTSRETAGATIASGAKVKSCGVAYGLTSNPDITGAKKKKTPTVANGVFTVRLGGLAPNTVYYYRGYGTTAGGTAYTANSAFTTLPKAPKATAPTIIKSSGFTAHWNPASGTANVGYFLYVANNAAFANATQHYAAGTSLAITVPSTGKYYYRVQAVNAGGASAYSAKIAVNVH